MQKLEKPEEDAVNRWAKNHNIEHRKMNGLGNRDWPDQLYYSPKGAFLPWVTGIFIEMKAPGKKPTEKQNKKMEELKSAGFVVAWFDNRKDAIAFLSQHLNK